MRADKYPGVSVILAILIILISNDAYSQFKYGSSRIIDDKDSLFLSKLPEKTFSNIVRTSALPFKVDNSKYKYFRDVVEQDDPSCGQHASVVYTFTYEINRVRNLPSNIPENQYPSHFAFNFMNGGFGWFGVSIHHSFEILKKVGCPNVEDFGGISCDPRIWMNGYEKYHKSMSNRIKDMYQIKVGHESGLLTLKNWLHNHLAGDSIGGLATFYANTPWNLNKLEAGTPDAGKFVISDWGGPPTHSMAIVGYNDSVRFDYNDDGQYTNNIDLNNDGSLDMRDWEIGALIFVDGFYDGANFADSGFCYMMYKTLAETYEDNGIWGNTVFVIEVNEPYNPELTARIKLKHNSRDKINVLVGVSADTNSLLPEEILSFPIINFHGGDQYMQGGNSLEANKTIEFGLDITALKNYIDPQSKASFFLQIMENDPTNTGNGEILEFEIFSYNNSINSAYCSSTPTSLINNDISTLKISFNPGPYNKLKIVEESIPEAFINQPYTFQLHASGGDPDYEWQLRRKYKSATETEAFPLIRDNNITPQSQVSGVMEIPLGFNFPFYNESFDTIYVHTDGFLMFTYSNDPWPYMNDDQLMIKSNQCIAPLTYLSFQTIVDNGQGIWMNTDTNYIEISWKVSSSFPVIENIEFACRMNSNGEVQFFYNNAQLPDQLAFSMGISNGDNMNFSTEYLHNINTFQNDFKLSYAPYIHPESLQLSDDGILSGFFSKKYPDTEIEVLLTDAGNNFHIRKYNFYTTGLGNEEYNFDNNFFDIVSYPNPFKTLICIRIQSKLSTTAKISIYDINGRIVSNLYDGEINTDKNIIWDGIDFSGNDCRAGIYILKADLPEKILIRKIIKQ